MTSTRNAMAELQTKGAASLCALIVTDGKMGDIAPCRGVASELHADQHEIVVSPNKLEQITRRVRLTSELTKTLDELPNPPDLIIASGGRAAPYLSVLKDHFGNAPLTVCLKDPRTGTNTADLIWVPTHDRLRGSNVIISDTSPHSHNAERRGKAAQALAARLVDYPRPWLGVILGGPTKRIDYSEDDLNRLRLAIEQGSARAGATLVTPSRRTPPEIVDLCHKLPGKIWIWDGKGHNPYPGMLGACDAFLVSGESHNMVSEVLSAGRQTMVFRPEKLHAKFSGFLDNLQQRGLITDPTAPNFAHHQEAIDATPEIAAAIKERLAKG